MLFVEFEAYSKGFYYFNTSYISSLLLAFIVAIIGSQLLWEKKLVPSVALVLSFLLGGFLGIGVNPLQASALVLSGSIIGAGIFVALNIEMTLVGFAVMAIASGFFHGHAYAVRIPDSANATVYILLATFFMACLSYIGFMVQRFTPKTSFLQIIGIVVGIIGILLLIFS